VTKQNTLHEFKSTHAMIHTHGMVW